MDEDYTYSCRDSLGAYGDAPPNLNTSNPLTQPFVTAFGSTALFVSSKGGYLAEEVWNDISAGGQGHAAPIFVKALN